MGSIFFNVAFSLLNKYFIEKKMQEAMLLKGHRASPFVRAAGSVWDFEWDVWGHSQLHAIALISMVALFKMNSGQQGTFLYSEWVELYLSC